MSKAWAGAPLALLLAVGAMQPADAAPTTVTLTGTMDGTDDGTPFTDAAFTAVATEVAPVLGGGGYTVYPATVTFDIAGVGTSLPMNGYAITIGPPQPLTYATYAVEFSAAGATLTEFFEAMATVIDPSAGEEILFSSPPPDPAVSFESSGSFVMSLTDGSTVTETAFDSMGPTAAVVPEPTGLALLGFGLVALSLWRRSPSRRSPSRQSSLRRSPLLQPPLLQSPAG